MERQSVARFAHVVYHGYTVVVELDRAVRPLLGVHRRVAVGVQECSREVQGVELVVVLGREAAHHSKRRNACDGRVQLSQCIVRLALVAAEDETGLVLGDLAVTVALALEPAPPHSHFEKNHIRFRFHL